MSLPSPTVSSPDPNQLRRHTHCGCSALSPAPGPGIKLGAALTSAVSQSEDGEAARAGPGATPLQAASTGPHSAGLGGKLASPDSPGPPKTPGASDYNGASQGLRISVSPGAWCGILPDLPSCWPEPEAAAHRRVPPSGAAWS